MILTIPKNLTNSLNGVKTRVVRILPDYNPLRYEALNYRNNHFTAALWQKNMVIIVTPGIMLGYSGALAESMSIPDIVEKWSHR